MKTPKQALKEIEYEATNEDSCIGRDELKNDFDIIKSALISKSEEKIIRENEIQNFTKYFVDIIRTEKLNREEIIERLQTYHKETTV